MDDTLRRLLRLASQGDTEAAAQVIQWRYRAGEISRTNIRVAAKLGNQAAREIMPEEPLTIWYDPQRSVMHTQKVQHAIIHQIASANQRPLVVKIGAAFVRHLALIVDSYRSGEVNLGRHTPEEALRAAEVWATYPSAGAQAAANDMAVACRDARILGRGSLGHPTWSAYCYAAQEIAFAAGLGLSGGDFAGYIVSAALTGSDWQMAPNHPLNKIAVYQWQSDFLIGVLLGQISI